MTPLQTLRHHVTGAINRGEAVAIKERRHMTNLPSAYAECGRRAALAMNQRDVSRYEFENRWYRSAKALEDDQGKLVASQAYEEAFRATRNIPPVEYFK